MAQFIVVHELILKLLFFNKYMKSIMKRPSDMGYPWVWFENPLPIFVTNSSKLGPTL